MENLAIAIVLISYIVTSQARPPTVDLKRKLPPPGVEFKSRDPKINMTIDELLSLRFGSQEEIASRVMGGGESILTELDLMLTAEQFAAFHPHESDILSNNTEGSRKKRKAIRDTVYRWTYAEIPYTLEQYSFNSEEQFMIREAMNEWERYTCVKFKPATQSHRNFVKIINGQYCLSQLGMVGGKQELQLHSPGCRFRGLYLHEIGHSLGLIHEHQRPDRDNYIDIIWQNVDPELTNQFNKYTLEKADLVNTTYEYSSVMHYSTKAFSRTGKETTIRAKDPAREEEIGFGYLKELSFMDVKAVNNMYSCSVRCPKTIQCSHEGYVDENCRCVCPDGTRDCEVGYVNPRNEEGCSNIYDDWQCSVWANSGQCHRNKDFMSTNCIKACRLCGTAAAPDAECVDLYPRSKCYQWEKYGQCVANEDWMSRNCRKTCNACVSKDKRSETMCENKHSDSSKCEEWAGEGECVINRVWMLNNCQKACQYCHKTPPVVTACQDSDDQCPVWADQGECENNPQWMKPNCRLSCGTCDSVIQSTPRPQECEDSDDQCPSWADQGECENNPQWMKSNCRLSCGTCDSQPRSTPRPQACQDSNDQCPVWADLGECENNPLWMKPNCQLSCGTCDSQTTSGPQGSCVNLHTSNADCEIWAVNGHCEINPSWMHEMCRKSCGLCQDVTEKPGFQGRNSGSEKRGSFYRLVMFHIVVLLVRKLTS